MKMPNIKTVLEKPVNGVKFEVLAYRKLTDREMLQAVAHFFRSAKKKPKPGSTITIVSVIQ